jgi:hypothetical protein
MEWEQIRKDVQADGGRDLAGYGMAVRVCDARGESCMTT